MKISVKKNIIALFVFIALVGILPSCKKQSVLLQIDGNVPAPAMVTILNVERTPGGAKINYKLPKDENLLYVKAIYEIHPGVTRETKSSIYKDTLVIGGFGDTLAHDIKIYSVGRNDKASVAVTVTVNPLLPPVKSVYKNLVLQATFGGAAITFDNPSEDALAIVLMHDSTGNGDWATVKTYYTGAPKGIFSVRGFDSVKTKFGVYIRDRWNNKSDTLIEELKPLYEQVIDKSRFKEIDLPNDTYAGHVYSGLPPRAMNFLWNNIWNSHNDIFHTSPGDPHMPLSFTFDMGTEVTLSRFKLFSREGSSGAYTGGDPKIFEVWGSNDPDKDGGWNNWTKLQTFTSVKPTPGSVVSSEDLQYAVVDGQDFEFPLGIPQVRFLRFKVLETWGGFQYIYISELSFWGTEN